MGVPLYGFLLLLLKFSLFTGLLSDTKDIHWQGSLTPGPVAYISKSFDAWLIVPERQPSCVKMA